MNILTGILKFFKTAFSNKYIKITLVIAIAILIILNLRTCNSLKQEKMEHKKDVAMYENNLIAMNDSITAYYDKELDRMVSEKTSLLVKSVDDLKKYNEDMYEEFKTMKNMIAGIQSDVNVIVPELRSEIRKVKQDPNDSTKFDIPFEFNFGDEGLTQKIEGFSKISVRDNYPSILYSQLDTNRFNIKLRYALTEDDNTYTVKAFSPSPLVKFTELDGAMTIDKVVPDSKTVPTRITLGPYVGVGFNKYGDEWKPGVSVGVSVGYNFLSKQSDKKGINDFFKGVFKKSK